MDHWYSILDYYTGGSYTYPLLLQTHLLTTRRGCCNDRHSGMDTSPGNDRHKAAA